MFKKKFKSYQLNKLYDIEKNYGYMTIYRYNDLKKKEIQDLFHIERNPVLDLENYFLFNN